jgi:hypothetical protein
MVTTANAGKDAKRVCHSHSPGKNQFDNFLKTKHASQALVAHICNPSYLGG